MPERFQLVCQLQSSHGQSQVWLFRFRSDRGIEFFRQPSAVARDANASIGCFDQIFSELQLTLLVLNFFNIMRVGYTFKNGKMFIMQLARLSVPSRAANARLRKAERPGKIPGRSILLRNL